MRERDDAAADHVDAGRRLRAHQSLARHPLRPDRLSGKALHGDGGNPLLARRMRAHANFAEYTPVVLILFALVELAIGSPAWLWIGALVYALARIAHGFGMDADHPTIWRAGGALLTWVISVGLAVAALYVAYHATRAVPAPPALAAQV